MEIDESVENEKTDETTTVAAAAAASTTSTITETITNSNTVDQEQPQPPPLPEASGTGEPAQPAAQPAAVVTVSVAAPTTTNNNINTSSNSIKLEDCDDGEFNWELYLKKTNSSAAVDACFCQNAVPPVNEFKKGHKLETYDPRNTSSTCIASVIETHGPRLRLRLDGTDDRNDFWLMCDSDQLHAYGYSARLQPPRKIQPPLGYGNELSKWPKFLEKLVQLAQEKNAFAPDSFFKQPPGKLLKNEFKVGDKLEAVDPKNPHLICPATVKEIRRDKLFISFDGWSQSSQFWVHFASRDLFPCGWCRRAGHVLQYPGNLEEKQHQQAQKRSSSSSSHPPVQQSQPIVNTNHTHAAAAAAAAVVAIKLKPKINRKRRIGNDACKNKSIENRSLSSSVSSHSNSSNNSSTLNLTYDNANTTTNNGNLDGNNNTSNVNETSMANQATAVVENGDWKENNNNKMSTEADLSLVKQEPSDEFVIATDVNSSSRTQQQQQNTTGASIISPAAVNNSINSKIPNGNRLLLY
jgi:phage tail tube protein FII